MNRHRERYSLVVIILHWTMAILILGLLGLGWYMVGIATGTPARGYFFNLHKSIGLVAILITALFTGWRVYKKPPAYPGMMARWEARCATLAHWLVYGFLIVVPLTGYLEANFNRWGITFFGMWQFPPWGPDNEALRDLLNTAHVYSANCFAVLIAIHIGAALKHLVINRDRIMQRILPF